MYEFLSHIWSRLHEILDDIVAIDALLQADRPMNPLTEAQRLMLGHERAARQLWAAWNLGDQEEPWIYLERAFGVTEAETRSIAPQVESFYEAALEGVEPEASEWANVQRQLSALLEKSRQPASA